MKTTARMAASLLVAVLLACTSAAEPKEKIRPAAVAGSFYPADPAQITKMMDAFLARVPPQPATPRLVALVAPHAGYEYSGPVAAYSYALLKGRKYERVVVISPSHYEAFPFSAVYDGDAYVTPLGRVPVDKQFAARLARGNSLLRLSSQGHVQKGNQGEHALEVELPWLQHVLGEFKLVPVVMGNQSYDASRALGVALAKMVGPETLIVASSDLSHFHTYEQATALDHKTLNAVADWDYLSMSRNFEQRTWEACGGGPVIAAMMAAERLGATQAKVLRYANTGDVTGDRTRVVGYGAAAFFADAQPRAAAPEFALTADQKDALLQLARKSVETAVNEKKLFASEPPKSAALLMDRGAFVTLKKKGELRGCIGYVSPLGPLHQTVRDVAAYAALKDPRFPPVRPGELRELEYEISVLSPMRRVLDLKQIDVGKHGLLVRKGNIEGVLLPQVPVEQHWDRSRFLVEICYKAGLARDCAQDPEADLFLFSALVFGENSTQPRPQAPGSPQQ